MFNFNFPEKCLGLVSPPHFVYDFSRKLFLILLTDQSLLPLLLEVFGNMYTTTVWCDVVKFEINLIFLIKLFCYMTKKTKQKF